MESANCESALHRAASTIEERVREIAEASQLEVVLCRWHLNRGAGAARPHRIDLHFNNTVVKVYFLDCEILSYGEGNDSYQVETRLQRLAGELKAVFANSNVSEQFMKYVPAITVTTLDLEKIEELLDSDASRHLPGADALKCELERANVIEPHDVPPGLVTMNSTVRCRDESTMSEYELTLVYPNAANQPDRVSILAPVGSALLGLSVGQKISWQAPGGRILLHVLEVRYQPEAQSQLRQ
jgi:regulator of nucleoside diphosphate kinase